MKSLEPDVCMYPVSFGEVEQFEESPNHWYRAYYSIQGRGGQAVIDICFDMLPVVTETPCGVWLSDPCDLSQQKWKWVSSSAKKRYAYPSKKEAIESLLIRKKHHLQHLKWQVHCMETAVEMLAGVIFTDEISKTN